MYLQNLMCVCTQAHDQSKIAETKMHIIGFIKGYQTTTFGSTQPYDDCQSSIHNILDSLNPQLVLKKMYT